MNYKKAKIPILLWCPRSKDLPFYRPIRPAPGHMIFQDRVTDTAEQIYVHNFLHPKGHPHWGACSVFMETEESGAWVLVLSLGPQISLQQCLPPPGCSLPRGVNSTFDLGPAVLFFYQSSQKSPRCLPLIPAFANAFEPLPYSVAIPSPGRSSQSDCWGGTLSFSTGGPMLDTLCSTQPSWIFSLGDITIFLGLVHATWKWEQLIEHKFSIFLFLPKWHHRVPFMWPSPIMHVIEIISV